MDSVLILLIVFLFSSIFLSRFHKFLVQYTFMNKYKNYIELVNYFATRSYDLIYKDQIHAYTISGYTIQDELLETIQKNYIKLSLELMGKRITNLLSEYFGSTECLINNLVIYFRDRLDNDELIKLTEDQLESNNEI